MRKSMFLVITLLLVAAAVLQVQVPTAQSAECIEGRFKSVVVGPNCSCEIGSAYGTPRDQYQCIGGVWEYQQTFCGGPFCPGI